MSPTWREWQSLAEVKQDGEWYIASIPPLDLSSQGRSAEEASQNLQEAFTLFVESCHERGVLQKVF